MEEQELSPEKIAGHLQAALTEVRACLPGKPRTVQVGARDLTADDVRGVYRDLRHVKSRLNDLINHLYSTGGYITNEKLLEWTEGVE